MSEWDELPETDLLAQGEVSAKRKRRFVLFLRTADRRSKLQRVLSASKASRKYKVTLPKLGQA